MRIFLTDDLTEAQKEDVMNLLIEADNDFIPPLSSRSSTVNQNPASTDPEFKIPLEYFDELNTQKFILATDKGRIVAFLSYKDDMLLKIKEQEEVVTYISTVIVQKDIRNQGIAHKLLATCIKKCNKSKTLVSSATWNKNSAYGIVLYDFGFAPFKVIENDNDNGVHTVYFYRTFENHKKIMINTTCHWLALIGTLVALLLIAIFLYFAKYELLLQVFKKDLLLISDTHILEFLADIDNVFYYIHAAGITAVSLCMMLIIVIAFCEHYNKKHKK